MAAGTKLVSEDEFWLGGDSAFTTTEGNDFWLTFMNNGMFDALKPDNKNIRFEMKIAITAREAMTVNIAIGNQIVQTQTLADEETFIYEIDRNAYAQTVYLLSSEQAGYKGVHVFAAEEDKDKIFSCHSYCRKGDNADSYREASLILPTRFLGREYLIQTSTEDLYSSQFAIIATEDGTNVTVTPNDTTFNGAEPGITMPVITLNKGDAYLIASRPHPEGSDDYHVDLSGSLVCADKPIAVFNGNQQTSVPINVLLARGYSVEQSLPIAQWGRDFYLTVLDRTKKNFFRITAAYDGTAVNVITEDGAFNTTINLDADSSSIIDELVVGEDANQIILHSNQPIICYSYTTTAHQNVVVEDINGRNYNVNFGNPATAMIPSWAHNAKMMNFFTYEMDPQDIRTGVPSPQHFFVYLVTKTADVNLIQVDGVAKGSEFQPFTADPSMSFAHIELDNTNAYHSVETTGEGFVGSVYALAQAQGYYYTLGYTPMPYRDSLFITNSETLMSVKSYDMDSLDGHGWYQRQWDEWLEGHERLDTAVVCDSSFVYWTLETPIERPVTTLEWNLYNVTDGARELIEEDPFPREDTPDETTIKHELSYQFILPEEPMETRKQFYDYELEIIIHRDQVLCGGEELDTFRTVTRVTRLFNDTIWRAICMGDTLEFFKDSLYTQADLTLFEPGEKKETIFRTTYTPDPNDTPFEWNVDLGKYTFTRNYVSQFGCDSIMTLELYVCDTFRFVDTIHLCSNQDTVYHGYHYLGYDYDGNRRVPNTKRQRILEDTTVQIVSFKTDSCGCQKPEWKDKYKDVKDKPFGGCDSIYELHLFIHPSWNKRLRDTLDYNEYPDSIYHWQIERNGVTRDSLISRYTKKPNGDPALKWDNRVQALVGVFGDTLRTKTCKECNGGNPAGCDSINSLTLVIPIPYYFYDTVTWCRIHYNWEKHDTTFMDYKWVGHHHDIVYSEGGDYVDAHQSRYGVDSIYYLHLVYSQALEPIYDLVRDTVCKDTAADNRLYTWISNDGLVSVDTIRKDTAGYFYYVDESRCDSIYALELFVMPTYFIPDTVRMTQEQTYRWYFNDSVYAGTKAPQPYDSLITSAVTVITRNPGTDSIGTHSCDSIHQLVILIGNVYRDTVDGFACGNDTYYEWYGVDHDGADSLRMRISRSDLPAQGMTKIYADPHQTVEGNDSVYYLRLYRAPIHDSIDTYRVCQAPGQTFPWPRHEGHTLFDKTNRKRVTVIPAEKYGYYEYVDSLWTDSFLCDSVWTLRLYVDSVYHYEYFDNACQNRPYTWPDQDADSIDRPILTNHTGDYTYTASYHTVYGCDSTWTLHLHIDTAYTVPVETKDTFMCDKDSIIFIDRVIYGSKAPTKPAGEPGIAIPEGEQSISVFLDGSVPSSLGCDSAVRYNLTVYKTYYEEEPVTICQPLKGADSLYHWIGHDTVWDVQNQRYIPADSIPTNVEGGKTYTYIDSLRTTTCTLCAKEKGGCDSLFVLFLHIDSVYEFHERIVICENERVTWQGIRFTGDSVRNIDPSQDSIVRQADTYHDTAWYHVTTTGCDSIYYLELQINPVYHTYLHYTLCDNESDKHIYEFSDTHGAYFRDSLRFKPHRPAHEEDTAITWYPITYDTLEHTLRSVDGCDSIVTIAFKILPTYEFVTQGKGCWGEEVEWRGEVYSSTGIYYDRYKTKDGCDSIFVLEFLVKPVQFIPIYDTICESDTYIHFDTIWYPMGRYSTFETVVWEPGMTKPKPYADVVFKSANGMCDSIIYRYYLTIRDTFMYYADGMLCSNDTFYSETLDHHWIKTIYEYDTGVYVLPFDTVLIDSLTTVNGCDSLYLLTAHVFPAYRHVEYDTICGNETLLWRDTLLKDMPFGLHYIRDSFETVDGCDSIFELRLYVQPKYYEEVVDNICADETYDWRSYHYEHLEPGEHFFHDSLYSMYGCDSVFHLYLTVLDTTYEVRQETICIGDTIHVLDKIYSETGRYVDTTLNEVGCHHFLYTYLTVIEPTVPTIWIDEQCKNENVFDILYTFTSENPIAYSLYFDSLGHVMGFEDIIDEPIYEYTDPMVITVPTPLRDGDKTRYPRPDHYIIRLVLENGFCQRPQEDCVGEHDFVTNYPSWITEQRFGDVIAICNEQYNGGYTWDEYQWYHEGEEMVGQTNPYLYEPNGLIPGDHYSVRLRRTGEEEAFMSCPVTATADPVYDDFTPKKGYLSVVPTCIVRANPHANILSRKDGMYRISNSSGRLVSEGVFRADVTPIELPAVSGLYIVQLWSPDTPEEPYRSIKVIVKEKCEGCNIPF